MVRVHLIPPRAERLGNKWNAYATKSLKQPTMVRVHLIPPFETKPLLRGGLKEEGRGSDYLKIDNCIEKLIRRLSDAESGR